MLHFAFLYDSNAALFNLRIEFTEKAFPKIRIKLHITLPVRHAVRRFSGQQQRLREFQTSAITSICGLPRKRCNTVLSCSVSLNRNSGILFVKGGVTSNDVRICNSHIFFLSLRCRVPATASLEAGEAVSSVVKVVFFEKRGNSALTRGYDSSPQSSGASISAQSIC